MGVGGVDWLERREREKEELPDTALALMGLKSGMVVADVGAGSGYFTTRLAKLVGPSGLVYANDIQQEMIDLLKERIAREGLTNVVPVLGSEQDPKLPRNKLDLVLMVDVYHELSRPQEMLRKIRESLKPDGKLVLLEYRKEDPRIPVRPDHKMSVREVRAELEAEGYRMETVLKDLPRQHVFIFVKNTM